MNKKYEKIIAPHYIKNFTCIGGACEDSCCVGWHIPIDEETYKKYMKVKDKRIKGRLEREIVQKRSNPTYEHAAKIKLKNGRCAFLSQEGLCDIYSTLGKDYLSYTCTLYPRTINRINNTLECSLICSCPEAARQVLLSKEPLAFQNLDVLANVNVISADLRINRLKPTKWQDYFYELRAVIISILQNRNELIENRIKRIGSLMGDLEKHIAHASFKKIPELIGSYNEMVAKNKNTSNIKSYADDVKETIHLIKALQSFSIKKKIKSSRYRQCLEETFLGLSIKGDDLKQAGILYETSCKQYYESFIITHGYMLENYFVNYAFERCMPLDHKHPIESFKRMSLYYRLIKLHIVGIAYYNKHFTKEALIMLIQALSKTFDHDDESFTTILKDLQSHTKSF
ncbi:flagellin lysine-N-methylase [Cellulosilyticum sp. I15G10I2]|uniref:flagellin lysine-N-methylase n=1 Tax=Cellulosilyticum sp. I15G10I2 TaxID=1892843 RepID=UPI00085C4965|nr:flagellin lysine-N-methylase [Cellulosilyticum sp. I15G10I2]